MNTNLCKAISFNNSEITKSEKAKDFKYVYGYYTNVIHDKSCSAANAADGDFKIFLHHYNIKFARCPICEKKAFIRQGLAHKDEPFIDKYVEFFEKIGATADELYNFFIIKNAKVHFEGKNILHIFQNEDNWKIVRSKGIFTLYHNNYNVLKNGTREFAQGFHKQTMANKLDKSTFEKIYLTICGYSWENHRVILMKNQEEPKDEDERYLKVYTTVPREKDEIQKDNEPKYKYYIYEGVIHESNCMHVRLIPEHKKTGINEFSEEYCKCKKCLRKSIIKNGAEVSKKYSLDYFLSFFNKLKANNDDLKYLFLKHKAKAKFESSDVLKITLNGETWKIKNSYGIFELWHNNYTIKNGKRTIVNGFHLQFLKRNVSFYRMVREICDYSWESRYKYRDISLTEEKPAEEKNFKQTNRILLKCFNKGYTDCFFIDDGSNKALSKFINDNMLVKSKIKITQEVNVVYGKIKKENNENFEKIMEHVHMLRILRENEKYVNICAEFFNECETRKLFKNIALKILFKKYIFKSLAVDLKNNIC